MTKINNVIQPNIASWQAQAVKEEVRENSRKVAASYFGQEPFLHGGCNFQGPSNEQNEVGRKRMRERERWVSAIDKVMGELANEMVALEEEYGVGGDTAEYTLQEGWELLRCNIEKFHHLLNQVRGFVLRGENHVKLIMQQVNLNEEQRLSDEVIDNIFKRLQREYRVARNL